MFSILRYVSYYLLTVIALLSYKHVEIKRIKYSENESLRFFVEESPAFRSTTESLVGNLYPYTSPIHKRKIINIKIPPTKYYSARWYQL